MSEVRSSNPVASLREWLQEQWTRIPAVPHAQPGSYDRGYQNGMADILRGVQAQLDRSAHETPARIDPRTSRCLDLCAELRRYFDTLSGGGKPELSFASDLHTMLCEIENMQPVETKGG